MASSNIDGDLYVRGTLRANNFTPPNNSVGNAQFNSGDPLDANKQQQQFNRTYTTANGSAVADGSGPIHVAFGQGSVYGVEAGLVTANLSGATVVIDVLKNGVSIMTSALTLDDTHANREVVVGTVDGTLGQYVADDVFEVTVNATVGGGTLGQGLFVLVVFREKAQ